MLRDKVVYRGVELSNFFNETAAEKSVFSGGCQEDGFEVISQGFVGVGHLQLFFKVR